MCRYAWLNTALVPAQDLVIGAGRTPNDTGLAISNERCQESLTAWLLKASTWPGLRVSRHVRDGSRSGNVAIMDRSHNVAIVFELLDTAAAIERRLDRAVATIKGVSLSEYRLLAALQEQPRSTASRVDLAAAVGLTPSGVTRALKPLEKRGLVMTARGDRDARQALASLTDHGRELVDDATGLIQDIIEDLTRNGVTDRDADRVLALLKEFRP